MTTKFYAACLASYNSGVLHGCFVDVSTDTDEMHAAIATMLRASRFPNVTVDCPACETGRRGMGCAEGTNFKGFYECSTCGGFDKVPSAEEWCVHDWDDDTGLFSPLGETSDLARIAKLAEVCELAETELGDDWSDILDVWLDYTGREYWLGGSEPAEIVEACREAFTGSGDTFADWAEQWIDDMGLLHKVPEGLRHYFDAERWANDQDFHHSRRNGTVYVFSCN